MQSGYSKMYREATELSIKTNIDTSVYWENDEKFLRRKNCEIVCYFPVIYILIVWKIEELPYL